MRYNIAGTVSQELIKAGRKIVVNEVHITNTHASTTAVVDLFINNTESTFHLLNDVHIPAGVALVLDSNSLKFDNDTSGYGLFIKLASGAVDVLIT